MIDQKIIEMKVFTLMTLAMMLLSGPMFSQTLEELNAMKSEKQAEMDALQDQMNGIQSKIDAIPKGWEFGGVGIIGVNLNGNEGWFAAEEPYTSSFGYGLSAAAFANLDNDKVFWNNLLTLNLQKINTTTQDGPDGEEEEVESLNDALDLSSLFGYKLTKKFAISAEAKFTSQILSFLDPGKLVMSAGGTWTPIKNLVVIVHPIGYERNWPGELVSVAGAKIGATYARKLLPNVSWSSNLSVFVPYTGGDAEFTNASDETIILEYGAGDLFNWTWINSFSTNIWKNLGVGLNIGLRQDRQLADKFQLDHDDMESDNPIQLYYNLGIAYTF